MPRDRSPISSSRRRSRSRSRDRHRDRHDGHRRDRDSRRDDDRRRDRKSDKKERRRRDSSEDYRDKEYSSRKSRRESRSRTPESSDPNVENKDASDQEPKTELEKQMLKMLGFANFDSTKGKHVTGNNIYVANIQKKRKYRQYMNRRGGFNRKLDPIA